MNERDYLMSLLDYDQSTGIFTWICRRYGVKVGMKAGTINKTGYLQLMVDKKFYYGHRMAWLFQYGCWPQNEIDHINGIRSDNRISNLRDVTRRGNSINGKVHRNGKLIGTHCIINGRHQNLKRPWQASIMINKTTKHIGCYQTEQEAHEAYMEAYNEIEGVEQ